VLEISTRVELFYISPALTFLFLLFLFLYFYYYYFFSVYSDSINLFITTSTLLLGYACRVMSTASDLSAKHTRDRTDAEPCPPGRRFSCPMCRARSDIKQHTHARACTRTHSRKLLLYTQSVGTARLSLLQPCKYRPWHTALEYHHRKRFSSWKRNKKKKKTE